MAVVYFIQAGPVRGEGMIKIGIAIDLRRRMRNLQVGCPDDLNLIEAIEFGDSAALVEKALHELLTPLRRVRTEWFAPHPFIFAVSRHLTSIPEARRLMAFTASDLNLPVPPKMDPTHYLFNRNTDQCSVEEHW